MLSSKKFRQSSKKVVSYIVPANCVRLKCEGANNTFTFNNEGSAGTISVFSGAPVVITATKKYGTSSFNNTSGYIKTASLAECRFGTDDFTIEFWAYIFNDSQSDLMVGRAEDGTDTWSLHVNGNWNLPDVGFWTAQAGYFIGSGQINKTTWTHLAYSRLNGVSYMHKNGILQYSYSTSVINIDKNASGVVTPTSSIRIGGNCYMDDIHIQTGISKYTSANFTPVALV